MNESYLSASNKLKASKPLIDMIAGGAVYGNILDYGCGKGNDITFLSKIFPHKLVTGYDPHFQPEIPTKKYDTIFCNNVINYIEDINDVKATLLKASQLLVHNGNLIVIARSIAEVKGNVNRNKCWYTSGAGFKSTKNNVFQRGYDSDELASIVKSIGLTVITNEYDIPPVSYSYVIATPTH